MTVSVQEQIPAIPLTEMDYALSSLDKPEFASLQFIISLQLTIHIHPIHIFFSCDTYTCWHDDFVCRPGDPCEINCSGNKLACDDAEFYGYDASELTINCIGNDTSGATQVCLSTDMICPQHGDCTVNCLDSWKTCKKADIWCPVEGACNVNCIEGHDTCKYVDIYCEDDNPDDLIINCESSVDDNCKGLEVKCKWGRTCQCEQHVKCFGNTCPDEYSMSPTKSSIICSFI